MFLLLGVAFAFASYINLWHAQQIGGDQSLPDVLVDDWRLQRFFEQAGDVGRKFYAVFTVLQTLLVNPVRVARECVNSR